MKRSRIISTLAALTACALLPLAWASQKNPVPRPFKMQAHSQNVASLVDGNFEATAWGQATHCGRCVSLGWGTLNLVTGEATGSGKIIAANGDEIFFDNPNMSQSVITGGTGRFEGATGEFFIVSIERTGMEIDPMAGTMTQSFVWTVSGTICY
jgi:hypothetical protein